MGANAKITADAIVSARWVIPIEPQSSALAQHALVIKERRILDLLPKETAREKYRSKFDLDLDNQVLLPGLINAHGHAAMTLFRGLADDLPLMTWLNNHIWPAEQRWVSDDFVTTGTELAIAEMLLSGTTCFSDMYFFPNSVAKAAHRHRIRAHIYVPMLEFPSVWAKDADEYVHKGLKVHDDFRNHDLIQTVKRLGRRRQ